MSRPFPSESSPQPAALAVFRCEFFASSAGLRRGWGWAVGLGLGIGLALASGCSGRSGPANEPAIEAAPTVGAEDLAAATRLYAARCADCHGRTGEGDGPRAATLRPRPQRLSDRVWQSNVSNARLQRVILFGGAAVGKSEVMPASPELQGQPQTLQGLVALIRQLGSPPAKGPH